MKKNYLLITILVIGCLILTVYVMSSSVSAQRELRPDYQLLISSSRGDLDGVRQMLNSGVDPNTPPSELDKGMTALMFALWNRHEEIARLLIERGANVNAVSNTGATPLMYAAKNGLTQSVQLLLTNNADPNIEAPKGDTALSIATSFERVDAVKLLAKVTRKSENRKESRPIPLMAAVKKNNLALVDALLDTPNVKLDEQDKFGQTSLMMAARIGNPEIVARLLDRGANVNAVNEKGRTALAYAISSKRESIIQMLIAKGAKGKIIQ